VSAAIRWAVIPCGSLFHYWFEPEYDMSPEAGIMGIRLFSLQVGL